MLIVVEDVDVGWYYVIKIVKLFYVDVKDGYIGLEFGGDFCCVCINDVFIDNCDMCWGNVGNVF